MNPFIEILFYLACCLASGVTGHYWRVAQEQSSDRIRVDQERYYYAMRSKALE